MPGKERTEYPKGGRQGKSELREAAVAYRVPSASDREAAIATTRLSSKNQITIPVAMCRLMDMRPGDEIELLVMGDTVYMQRLPRTPQEWARRFDAAEITDPAWSTKERIDEYIRGERDSWDKEYDWPSDSSGS